MLKKLLTGCLTIVAAAALAVPAMAAEMSGKVGGRAVADLVSTSYAPGEGDGYSYMDMFAQGRIDYTLTATEGDWTATGKVEYRSNYTHDAYVSPVVLQKYAKFENDAVSFALGTQWFGFVYLTPYMGVSDSHDRYCYGCINLRDDRLIVGVKQVGLDLVYGTKLANKNIEDDFDGDGTDETWSFSDLQQTEIGLQYNGEFGPVTVAAQYVSLSFGAIENLSENSVTMSGGAGSVASGTDAKDSFMDGYVATEMAFAVRYGISEGMFAEFDYSAIGETPKDGDTATTTAMGVAFAMALSEAQGFSVAYDAVTRNSGASGADDYKDTYLTFTFNQKLGGQQLYAGYDSLSEEVDDSAGDIVADQTTSIVLGARVNF